jgi:ABC-2 type transport system ATP-binding protein
MIEVRNLSKSFGPLEAVKDLSFEIKEGEIVGFLGPNGAGKSTTIKMLTGYLTPTGGSARVAGIDTTRDILSIRKRVGYMPQDVPLYEDMVVLDYLRFISDVREIPSNSRREKLRDVAERCGIEKVITQSIGTLSSGYKQRVGLAQALIHNPDILILDEPTSDLDPNQIVEIRNLIKDIGKEKTVILSSHILSEVQATCGRVLIISEGKLVADGSPAELLAKERNDNIVHITYQHVGSEEGSNAIRALDFISGVRGHGDGRFVVEAEKGRDIRPGLFHLAVDRKWIILEMRTEQVSLEDVFRKLTTN